MYNSTFKCTYNLLSNDEEEDSLKEMLYRSQLLQAFNMNELDEESRFEHVFDYINNEMLKNEKGTIILNTMKEKCQFPVGDMELVLLFSYDYFDLFHNCLIDLFNTGDINDENYNMLIKKIENN
jgi:hypothetical protein